MPKNATKPATNLEAELEPEKLDDIIRTRAFELYEERGKEDGHDLDDWLKAESEITQGKSAALAA